MSAKIYIMVFDRESDRSYKEFHEELAKTPGIRTWWHYLPSAYLVKAELSIQDLSNIVTQLLEKHGLKIRHLILETGLDKYWGRLPKDAWAWIKEKSN